MKEYAYFCNSNAVKENLNVATVLGYDFAPLVVDSIAQQETESGQPFQSRSIGMKFKTIQN